MIKDVEDSVNYHAVIPSFLYNGRSAFYFLPGTFGKVGNIDKIDIGNSETLHFISTTNDS